MSIYSGQVTTYGVWVGSSLNTTENGSRMIYCDVPVNTSEDTPNVTGFNVQLFFIPSGQTIPPNTVPLSGSTATSAAFGLSTPAEDYPAVLDLLRNESELSFQIDDANSNGWSFFTGPGNIVGLGQVTSPPVTTPPGPKPPIKLPSFPVFPGHLPPSTLPK